MRATSGRRQTLFHYKTVLTEKLLHTNVLKVLKSDIYQCLAHFDILLDVFRVLIKQQRLSCVVWMQFVANEDKSTHNPTLLPLSAF